MWEPVRSGSALPSLTPCTHCDPPAIEDLQKLLDTTQPYHERRLNHAAIIHINLNVNTSKISDNYPFYLASTSNMLAIILPRNSHDSTAITETRNARIVN